MPKKSLSSLLREHKKSERTIIAKLHAIQKKKVSEKSKKSKDKGGEIKKQKKPFEKTRNEITTELDALIKFFNLTTEHLNLTKQTPLSHDQIVIMNIDFEGLHFNPSTKDMSALYIQAKENSKLYNLNNQYKYTDYNIDQIPIWEEMKKFKSFPPLRPMICNQLAKINYNPEKLNQLKLADVLDLISTYNHEQPQKPITYSRTRFLKMFATCYGQEFYEKMSILEQSEDAKNFLNYIDCLGNPNKHASEEMKNSAEKFNVHHIKKPLKCKRTIRLFYNK